MLLDYIDSKKQRVPGSKCIIHTKFRKEWVVYLDSKCVTGTKFRKQRVPDLDSKCVTGTKFRKQWVTDPGSKSVIPLMISCQY